MAVFIQNDHPNLPVTPDVISDHGEKLLSIANKKHYELSILLTTDIKIQEINKLWRRKDKSTNVLSFPQNDDSSEINPSLGDIIISIDTGLREAKQKEVTIQSQLLILLIHGFVHLLGYDHERSQQEREKSQLLETEYLKQCQEYQDIKAKPLTTL